MNDFAKRLLESFESKNPNYKDDKSKTSPLLELLEKNKKRDC